MGAWCRKAIRVATTTSVMDADLAELRKMPALQNAGIARSPVACGMRTPPHKSLVLVCETSITMCYKVA